MMKDKSTIQINKQHTNPAHASMMKDKPAVQIVMTCCEGKDQAQHIAKLLVEEKLAACVNLMPVTSVYSWKGKLVEEGEQLLLIKTAASLAPRLQQRIKELHSYEVPEIVHLNAAEVEETYLNWLLGEVSI